MAIYIEKQIVATSALAVACLSTLAASRIKVPHQPEHQLTFDVLSELADRMEEAGIEKYDDKYFHGLIHPYDCYDLLASIPDGESMLSIKRKKKPQPLEAEASDGYVTVGSFRLVRTTGVGQLILTGKTSTLLDLVPVWLLAEKEIPQRKSSLLVA